MRHLIFGEPKETYKVCILVPTINRDEILKEYISKLEIDQSDVLVLDLFQSETSKKTPAKVIKEYISEELQPILNDFKIEYLLVADADYFKNITKAKKADSNLGYILPSVFGSQKTLYIPNFKAIFYDPEKIRSKIDQCLSALKSDMEGSYTPPGNNIIKFEAYPETPEEIEYWLNKFIIEGNDLTADIEGFSLKHTECGIGTIAFAWNQHEGIAFKVDYSENGRIYNFKIRSLLRNFFRRFTGKLIWHNISFDIYILIYQLFMSDILDTKGLLQGSKILLKNWDDTKLISYLATNSCAGNKLGLKDQSQEFAGNYALMDIEDITKIEPKKLLRYNLIDALSTWYVYNKNYPIMIKDDQLDIYTNLFKPTIHKIIQMQLTGLPLNMDRVVEVKNILENDESQALDKINNSVIVKEFVHLLNEKFVEKKNATYKVKRITIADANQEFNPGSGLQLQQLLFEFLDLPVLSYTDSKQPSTDTDTLKALKNHTDDESVKELLDAILDLKAVSIILNTFIKTMLNAPKAKDGWNYLFGNFNLGGTVSGRLSSSKP